MSEFQSVPSAQGPLTDEQLKAMLAQAQTAGLQPAEFFRPSVTVENLDAVFTYHEWSEEQKERGKAIRAAAKDLAAAILAVTTKAVLFTKSIVDSGPAPDTAPASDLQRYAAERRQEAFRRAHALVDAQQGQRVINAINETVMIANSAITFEAAVNVPKEAV